jgi:hypothetical protein
VNQLSTNYAVGSGRAVMETFDAALRRIGCFVEADRGCLTTHTPSYVVAGLQSLRWLMSLQTASTGCFRPVGTHSFGKLRQKPEAFDQQPVDASATISACLVAYRADGSAEWLAGALRAFYWFLGENDLQITLINPDTGGCSDGLHSDRPNENKGAESALSYLLGLVEMRASKHTVAIDQTRPTLQLMRSAENRSTALRATVLSPANWTIQCEKIGI